jgi:methionyl-tRNA synthetase
VDVPYFLSKYDPDPLRFYLTATAPETRDTEACPEGPEGSPWEDFVERNNHVLSANEGNELVATARLSSRRSLGQLGQRSRGLGSA